MATATPTTLKSAAGFYIATGKWLDTEFGVGELHKVGHTGDLGARLNDGSYITCFPPGHWRYVATFELPTKEEAFLLETAVLHCCRHRRLDPRELVRMRAEEIIAVAVAVADALGLKPVRRNAPKYATALRGASLTAANAPSVPTAWAASKSLVDRLTIPKTDPLDDLAAGVAAMTIVNEDFGQARAAPLGVRGLASTGTPPDLSDYVDDILSWDSWEVVPTEKSSSAVESAIDKAMNGLTLVPAVASVASSPTTMNKPSAMTASPSSSDLTADELEDALLNEALGEFVLAGEQMDASVGVGTTVASSPFDLRNDTPMAPMVLRAYQTEARELCVAELRANGRAILQMACRCGKTPVSAGIIRDYHFAYEDAADEGSVNILYLVPGLSLLRQTAQKLASYGITCPMLLVGSDLRPVPMPSGRGLTMTTDPAVIAAFLSERGRRLVISTYQSSPQVPTDRFVLTIFDECHRVCGGRAPRPFNHFILAPRVGARLFMTATPAYDAIGKAVISMKDRELFGGVAYRYHLRQGITAGYVNDFRLEVVAAPAPMATDSVASARLAEESAIPSQLMAAMSKVDKMLVFCRDIGHATRLHDALKATPLPAGTLPFESLVAHSRMGAGGAAGALRTFAVPGARSVLFNCRLFQEGVEIPALNAVFFAAPRHSPRDIIQSVCRPLNHMAGKPLSVIFLPILHDPARKPEDIANLKRYASIVPFVDALLDEDPRLYEHLLDPTASPYPIEILGTHSLALADKKARASLLGAVRRAVRYGASTAARPVERLLRAENVPWDRAFAEVQRIVETCNRYPKTTDAWVVGEARVCLHRIYRWMADEFKAFREGKPSKLEPHQIHDLLQLPKWEQYGVEGPYPWKECMAFLDQWLIEHNGEPPMVEINKGGYIGLEASGVERLSGALTCINQGDGKNRKGKPGTGFTVSLDKQRDLDALCAKHRLRWRKERDETGELIEDGPRTFIQEAYSRFKAYYAAHGSDGEYIQLWFEGYPLKHRRQENMEVQESGVAPPRWKTVRKAAATATATSAKKK